MRRLVKLCLLSLFLFVPGISLAEGPTVSSLSVSSSYINHGYDALFSWTIPDGYFGQQIRFSCPVGVSISVAGGSVLSCGTYYPIGIGATSGSESFAFYNISGYTQNVTARLVPLTDTGARNESGGREVSVSVTTLPQPLIDFKASTSTVASGDSLTLSWIGNGINGVNMQFDCVQGITLIATDQSGSPVLPCGNPAFKTNLAGTGSITLKVVNDSLFGSEMSAIVFPSIGSDLFDGTHTLSTRFFILGKTIPRLATIKTFSSSSSKIASGGEVLFSWTSQDAKGVNVQFECAEDVEIMAQQVGTTTVSKVSCNTPVFISALPSAGNTNVTFVNKGSFSRTFSVTVIPQNNDSTYNGIGAKSVFVSVERPGVIVNPPASQAPLQASTTSPVGKRKVVRDIVFTTPLFLGSRGTQVTALQKLLAQDLELYPEGLVSGYFGKLTELALKRFQIRYGVATINDQGYGFVGPKTRAKLNSLEYF